MSYSFDDNSSWVNIPYEDKSHEEYTTLEGREVYILTCLQSNISDSFKDGLRWELDIVQRKKRSILEKMKDEGVA